VWIYTPPGYEQGKNFPVLYRTAAVQVSRAGISPDYLSLQPMSFRA
jgi:hypothetical protein